MALTGNYTLSNGRINLNSAYLRIHKVSLISNEGVNIEIRVYKDKSTRESGANNYVRPSLTEFIPSSSDLYSKFFSIKSLNVEGSNLIRSSYKYLKGLSDYNSMSDD